MLVIIIITYLDYNIYRYTASRISAVFKIMKLCAVTECAQRKKYGMYKKIEQAKRLLDLVSLMGSPLRENSFLFAYFFNASAISFAI